jgi:hypothetical protein
MTQAQAAERKTKRNLESLKNSGDNQYWSGSAVFRGGQQL